MAGRCCWRDSDCEGDAFSRGLCRSHYFRALRKGTLDTYALAGRIRRDPLATEQIAFRVSPDTYERLGRIAEDRLARGQGVHGGASIVGVVRDAMLAGLEELEKQKGKAK